MDKLLAVLRSAFKDKGFQRLLIIVIVFGCGFKLLVELTRPEPLYVAVVEPEAQGLWWSQLAADAVSLAATDALTQLVNVHPLDVGVTTLLGSRLPEPVCRAVGADEMVLAELETLDNAFRVNLTRFRQNEVIWSEVVEADGLSTLAWQVERGVRIAYADRRAKYGQPNSHYYRSEDLTEYLELRRTYIDHVEDLSLEDVVARLDRIWQRSPGLVAAAAWEVSLAAYLGKHHNDPSYLKLAEQVLRQARRYGGDDARVNRAEIELAFALGDPQRARQAVDRVFAMAPNDPNQPLYQARLLEHLQMPTGAIRLLHMTIAKRADWRQYHTLTNILLRQGRLQEARDTIGKAAEIAPNNVAVIAKLGELELYVGNVAVAEEFLLRATSCEPRAVYLTNVATAQLLLGRYKLAIDNYKMAIAKGTKSNNCLMSLADALLLSGDRQEASEYYRKAEAATRDAKDAKNMAINAHCNLMLGNKKEAVAKISHAELLDGKSVYVAYISAGVHSTTRSDLAVDKMSRARDFGLSESWFQLPWFN